MTGLGNAEQISLVPVKKYWTELTCTVLWLSGCTLILLLVLIDVKDIVYYFDLFCRDWLGIIYFPKRRYMVWSLSCFPDNPKTSISQCGHLMGKKIWIFLAVWLHRPVVTSGIVKIQNYQMTLTIYSMSYYIDNLDHLKERWDPVWKCRINVVQGLLWLLVTLENCSNKWSLLLKEGANFVFYVGRSRANNEDCQVFSSCGICFYRNYLPSQGVKNWWYFIY